jgi:hypothetical protein
MASNVARIAPEQTGNDPQLSSSAADLQVNIPNEALSQAEVLRNLRAAADRRHLHLVPPAPPPRPRRLQIQISVSDGRAPIGRTRPLRLRESDLAWLIEAVERLARAS